MDFEAQGLSYRSEESTVCVDNDVTSASTISYNDITSNVDHDEQTSCNHEHLTTTSEQQVMASPASDAYVSGDVTMTAASTASVRETADESTSDKENQTGEQSENCVAIILLMMVYIKDGVGVCVSREP